MDAKLSWLRKRIVSTLQPDSDDLQRMLSDHDCRSVDFTGKQFLLSYWYFSYY